MPPIYWLFLAGHVLGDIAVVLFFVLFSQALMKRLRHPYSFKTVARVIPINIAALVPAILIYATILFAWSVIIVWYLAIALFLALRNWAIITKIRHCEIQKCPNQLWAYSKNPIVCWFKCSWRAIRDDPGKPGIFGRAFRWPLVAYRLVTFDQQKILNAILNPCEHSTYILNDERQTHEQI